ncbi:TetR/AcrR family transcriptional regulator [Streptomyces sp. SM11]|uniref:TetR/AcrR family transcriptional regulator n=1 Tax=Streptomyces sp. SM11 TaxID=565557 RepID=UPI000CD5179E|nr:TetR/AcrR family transcriptional regulator [Streptomyces sp. SM11]
MTERLRRGIVAKQERAARTHERFLDASATEFAHHGYAGANLQRIATHVGMTKGALYAHFPSKDALASEFISRFDEMWYGLLQETCDGDPPLTNLRRITVGLVHRLHMDVRFRAGLRLAHEEACSQGRTLTAVSDLSDILTQLIVDGQARKQLTTAHSPELISSLIRSLIFGAYYTGPFNGLGNGTEQVCQVWQLLSSGAVSETVVPEDSPACNEH